MKAAGIRNVAVAGLTATGSVASTVATACNKGFRVVALTDCIGATSSAELESATSYGLAQYSTPKTAQEFFACIV